MVKKGDLSKQDQTQNAQATTKDKEDIHEMTINLIERIQIKRQKVMQVRSLRFN